MVLVADDDKEATSKNTATHDETITEQNATVLPVLNNDGTATLDLKCQVSKAGKETGSASCETTITVKLDETKVIRSFVWKSDKETNETLLFVTPTSH